jgi:hypothetical protein
MDRADHGLILQELTELLKTYNKAHQFRTYAENLLWLTVYLAAGDAVRKYEVLDAFRVAPCQRRETWRYCAEWYARRRLPLPHEVAFALAESDQRSGECFDEVQSRARMAEEFQYEYRRRFSEGYVLAPGKNRGRVVYHPASPSLIAGEVSLPALQGRSIADPLNSSVLIPLVETWKACLGRIRPFQRVSGTGVRAELGQPAAETSPFQPVVEQSRRAEWQRMVAETVDEYGWPVMPVSRLAGTMGFGHQQNLTPAQSKALVAAADDLGYGIEPDFRYTDRPYEWSESIVLFRRQGAPLKAEEWVQFRAAAALLELGVQVAFSDQRLEAEELSALKSSLDGQFASNPGLAGRMQALLHLVLVRGRRHLRVAQRLKMTAELDERRVVGRDLVSIVGAKPTIAQVEIRALERAYLTLGVPPRELHDLLSQYRSAVDTKSASGGEMHGGSGPAVRPFHLDLERIRRIQQETEKVRSMLQSEDPSLNSRSESAQDIHSADSALNLAKEPPSQVNQSSAGTEADRASDSRDSHSFDDAGLGAGDMDLNSPPRADKGPVSLPPGASLDSMEPRFREFLAIVLAQPVWERSQLVRMGRGKGVMWNAAIEEFNNWSVQHFNDWLINDNGDTILVNLALLES